MYQSDMPTIADDESNLFPTENNDDSQYPVLEAVDSGVSTYIAEGETTIGSDMSCDIMVTTPHRQLAAIVRTADLLQLIVYWPDSDGTLNGKPFADALVDDEQILAGQLIPLRHHSMIRLHGENYRVLTHSDAPQLAGQLTPVEPGWAAFDLFTGANTIGRSEENSIDISAWGDRYSSRLHARIEINDNEALLHTLSSSHKNTRLNNVLVEFGTPAELHTGDLVTFGKTSFRVTLKLPHEQPTYDDGFNVIASDEVTVGADD